MVERSNRSERAEYIVQVRRCACVVKGGRRFSFGALVVVGDGNGSVGMGYGKAPEVPVAVEKAVKAAERSATPLKVRARDGSKSIEHRVDGKCGASRVTILPAGAGTGVIAGGVVRSVLSAAGYTDILAKSKGSNNPATLVSATLKALRSLRSRADIQALRGGNLVGGDGNAEST